MGLRRRGLCPRGAYRLRLNRPKHSTNVKTLWNIMGWRTESVGKPIDLIKLQLSELVAWWAPGDQAHVSTKQRS